MYMKFKNIVELNKYASKIVEILEKNGYIVDDYDVRYRNNEDKKLNIIDVSGIFNNNFIVWCRYELGIDEDEDDGIYRLCRIADYSIENHQQEYMNFDSLDDMMGEIDCVCRVAKEDRPRIIE